METRERRVNRLSTVHKPAGGQEGVWVLRLSRLGPRVETTWASHRQRIVWTLLRIGLVIGFWGNGAGIWDENGGMGSRWRGGRVAVGSGGRISGL